MIAKVLVAEDQESIRKGLVATLRELGIKTIEDTSYCDTALIKIKLALKGEPFDLLITDLEFNEDHIKNNLQSGVKLIEAAKKIQPKIKVLVFSVENKLWNIKKLLKDYEINAYVLKGRRESEDIFKSIQAIIKGRQYFSEPIAKLLHNSKNVSELCKSDTLILQLLAKGLKQKEISDYFKQHKLPSGSQRSIEYRLQELKTMFDAQTLPQLISIAKDVGLI